MSILKHVIAKAIQKADNSYFYEDYVEQALKVLIALQNEGLKIVPTKPTKEMIKYGVEAIPYGNTEPEHLVEVIYEAMIQEQKG